MHSGQQSGVLVTHWSIKKEHEVKCHNTAMLGKMTGGGNILIYCHCRDEKSGLDVH